MKAGRGGAIHSSSAKWARRSALWSRSQPTRSDEGQARLTEVDAVAVDLVQRTREHAGLAQQGRLRAAYGLRQAMRAGVEIEVGVSGDLSHHVRAALDPLPDLVEAC